MSQDIAALVIIVAWAAAWWWLARRRIRKGGGKAWSVIWTGAVSLLVVAFIGGSFLTPKTTEAETSTATAKTPPATEVSPAKPQPAAAPIDDAYKTTAAALNSDYDRNEVATDLKIGSRAVEVTGRVQSIDKDFLNHVVVQLAAGNEFLPASMSMEKSETAKAAELSKGDRVTIRCEKMHRIMNSPAGSDCVLL